MAARGLAPELLTQWWSTFPARLAGLAASKGAIAEGLDADIVVWASALLAAVDAILVLLLVQLTRSCCSIARLTPAGFDLRLVLVIG